MLIPRRSLLVAFLSVVVPVAMSLPSAGAEPFVINVILPLTGPASFIGSEERQALDLLAVRVNRGGGIRGRSIAFSVQDDQSNPQISVQLTNGLIARKVAIIIGSSSTGPCGAMMPLVAESGPVMYCLSPGLHPAANTYAFSSSVSTKDELVAIARYSRGRKWKRIALMTSTDATGQDAERSATDAFSGREAGFEFVAREHFAISDLSTTAQLTRIKATNPDLIIAWTTGTAFGTILRNAVDVGIKTPIVTTDGNETYVQMKQYAAFLPKELYFPAKLPLVRDSADNPAYPQPVRKAIANYFAAFREQGVEPDNGQSLAWDPGNIVLDAFRQIGFDATAPQIKQYIEGLHGYIGAAGVYDFRDGSQRGLTEKNAIIVRWSAAKNHWVPVSKLGGEPL